MLLARVEAERSLNFAVMENQTGQPSKKNSNVIYFLIVVVLALLATDVYLYLQKNKSDTRIVTETGEKTKLQSELDSLHTQLEEANSGKAKLSTAMQAKNDSLDSRITFLQRELKKGKLTQKELDDAIAHPSTDDLKVAELKRRKLLLRDEIERLRQDASVH